eukprot:snap_masked-scaffold_4-processed-gene-17.38-mRNA-1 protein AED:0.01 eAED:0.01 QI:0/-1/0/1/-1/1/1/0/348
MKTIIEYRSDTFTQPTSDMKKFMLSSALGDDCYGEDPTINQLQEYGAQLFGKEAALFMPTCTMSNLTALSSHCRERLSAYIIGDKQHIYKNEVGGGANVASVHPLVIPNQPDGTLDFMDVSNAIPIDNSMFPVAKLVCIENTHNACGGKVLSLEYMIKLKDLARRKGLKIHLDGARVFNAISVLGCDPKEIGACVDSLSICFSKGLSCPTGALLVGSKEFISVATRVRRSLGGGLRQGGIIASFGLFALQNMTKRLSHDHEHLRLLYTGLQELQTEKFKVATEPQSNMLYLECEYAAELRALLAKEYSIRLGYLYGSSLRIVTHPDVSIEHVDFVIKAFKECLLQLEN